MNAVDIDVSKGKSIVAILRPYVEVVFSLFKLLYTTNDINSLVELIKSVEGESRIVMKHTGRYYEPLAHHLSQTDLFGSTVNPKPNKGSSCNSLRRVEFDRADVVKTARYTLTNWSNLNRHS